MLFSSSSLLATALFAGAASAAPLSDSTVLSRDGGSDYASDTILFGSYSGSTIFTADFTPPSSVDAADGKLVQGKNLTTGTLGQASWVVKHPSIKDIIYAVQEVENGGVIVGRLSDEGHELEVLQEASTGGAFPAHATVTADGSALLACNYGGGSCVIVPLNSTGLFPVSTTDAPTESSPYLYTFPFVPTTTPLRNLGRQESSHPHQLVEVSAEDREFWVNDLGQDKVWKLRVVGEGNDLSWESVGELELTGDEGGGPRHSVVSEDKHDIYVINELFPTLTHSRIATSDSDNTTTLISKTSMIPPPPAVLTPQNTTSSTAELLLLPTTPLKTLVGSTRQLAQHAQDALGMFDLNEDGTVKLTQFVFPRQGREFRGVGASQDGKYVVAAGQADGWVSVFGKNSTGSWVEVVQEQIQLDKPTHVLFL